MNKKRAFIVALYIIVGSLIFGAGMYAGYYRSCSEISKKSEWELTEEYHELRHQAQSAWIRFLVQPYMRNKGIVSNVYKMSTEQFVRDEKVILNALELMKMHEKQKKETGKGIFQPHIEQLLAEYFFQISNMIDAGTIPKIKEVEDWLQGIK